MEQEQEQEQEQTADKLKRWRLILGGMAVL